MNDFAVQRTSYGSVVVIKPDHKLLTEGINATVVEITLISVLQLQPINILWLDRPPKQKRKPLEITIEQKLKPFCSFEKSVVIGDFNTDNTMYKQLYSIMKTYQFTQITITKELIWYLWTLTVIKILVNWNLTTVTTRLCG